MIETAIPLLLAVYIGLSAADLWLTGRGLSRGGWEINPLARWAYAKAGFGGLAVLKIILAGFAVAALLLAGEPYTMIGLAVLCVGMAGVVIWNATQLK